MGYFTVAQTGHSGRISSIIAAAFFGHIGEADRTAAVTSDSSRCTQGLME